MVINKYERFLLLEKSARLCKEHSVSFKEMAVISGIRLGLIKRPGDVSARLGISPQESHRVLKRLDQDKALVIREKLFSAKNTSGFSLTTKGEEISDKFLTLNVI